MTCVLEPVHVVDFLEKHLNVRSIEEIQGRDWRKVCLSFKSSHHFFSDHISNNLLFLILCISLVSPYLSRVQCWYVICIKKFLYPIWCKYCYINECVNQKLKKLFQTGQAGAKECPNRDNPHADSSNAQDCRVQWWTYFRIEVVTHQSHSYIYIYIQDVQLYLPDFNFYFESSIVLFCDEVFVVVCKSDFHSY